MYQISQSPVKDVTFGQAAQLSLDNFYDLLKLQVGGLNSEEYLQIKLVADSVDISSESKASAGGYKWFSYYNLLERSDKSISPTPVNGTVQTNIAELNEVFGNFLRKLRNFVVKKELSPEDQKQIADIDVTIDSLKRQARELAILDRTNWRQEAEAMGYDVGDMSAYVQWSSLYGHLRDIQTKVRQMQDNEFAKKTILDKQYPNPDDRKIVEAEFNFENPLMRLRYPIFADYEYPNGDSFNLTYLALLPPGSTGLFDDRRVLSWNRTLNNIKTNGDGSFTGNFDRNTAESKSITTDWKASADLKYNFIRVKANASEHKQIQKDFNKGTKISLGVKAAFKVLIQYPDWLDATLFTHRHVKENPHDFEEFFGEMGTLLYYPTELVLVRGFNITFDSSQNWTYDYSRRFSASGGGGFNAYGINFGSSTSYSSNEKEHKVDVSSTKLTIADDETTLRFVGYVVKKNTVYEESIASAVVETLGNEVSDALAT